MSEDQNTGLLATAEQIHSKTGLLVRQIRSSGISEPSLAPSCTSQLWDCDNSSIRDISDQIVALSRNLALALEGPKRYLWEFVGGAHYGSAAMATILEFKVLESIPVDGHAHVSHLARESGLDEDKLLRILRVLACDHAVYEVHESCFRHTAISALLVNDKHTRALMEMQLGEASRASTRLAETLKAHPKEDRSGHSAFKTAWGEVPYQWYAKNPEAAARFALAMEGTTRGLNWDLSLLHRWFEAKPINGRDRVIDVGGGSGHVCISLAKAFHNMEFIVQDLIETMFRASMQTIPEALQKQFAFQQHDFLRPQPVHEPNRTKAYILRMILWNWADDVAILILQAFVPVMELSPEIALLINDGICSDPNTVGPHVEKGTRHLDMAMMVLNNAKVRTELQWRELIAKASPNFKLTKIESDPSGASTVALMDVRWVADILAPESNEELDIGL